MTKTINIDLGNGREFAFTSMDDWLTQDMAQALFDKWPEKDKAIYWAAIQEGKAPSTPTLNFPVSLDVKLENLLTPASSKFPISHDTIFGKYHDDVTRAISNLNNNDLVALADLIGDTLLAGKQVVLCGVAGAGYVASHFVSDAQMGLILPMCRVSSLSDNTGLTAAWANDVGLDSIFSGQVARIMDKGDLLIGLSTSGHSESVIKAMREARMKGCNVTCITGKTPNNLGEAMFRDATAFSTKQKLIEIDSTSTPAIQDVYQFIFHAIYLYLVEKLKNKFVKGLY